MRSYADGYLHLQVSKAVTVVGQDEGGVTFHENRAPQYACPVRVEGAGSKWLVGIGSKDICYLPYRAEVLCIPGKGSIYAIIGEMGFGSIVGKCRIDGGACQLVDLPMNMVCQEASYDLGNQDLFYSADIRAPKIGQVAKGTQIDIIGMRE